MALLTCKLCRKIYTVDITGGKVCPDCKQRLDALYGDVRNYLRDNPKVEFNVETLADALGADIRDIQGMVDLGYLDRDLPEGERGEAGEDSQRQKLAKEFEQSLDKMRAAAAEAAARKPVSYGQTLYGDKQRKR